MRVLIDTHIYLWALSDPEKLSDTRRHELESPDNEVFLSAMSIAELMIKQSIGNIDIQFDPVAMAQETGFQVLSFSGEDAIVLGTLPLHHRDLLDRMLVAQAIANRLSLMSDSTKLLPYDCKII